MITSVQVSLEDVRNARFRTVAEFADDLSITQQTYRRILQRDTKIQNTTKRQIAERLNMAPHMLAELIPPPTIAYLASLTEATREANRDGWFAWDVDAGVIAETPSQRILPAINE